MHPLPSHAIHLSMNLSPTLRTHVSLLIASAIFLFFGLQTTTPSYAFLTNPVTPLYGYLSAGTSQFISSGTLAAATPLTLPTINTPTLAQICVETAPVRYRDDGIAPTSSVGIPVAANTCFQYVGPLSKIQFIAQSGSPTMDIAYYYAGNS